MSAEHWLWWLAGVIVGASAMGLWMYLSGGTPNHGLWQAGYDAGVLAVKASRSRAAKAGHETRAKKRGSENVVVRPTFTNIPPAPAAMMSKAVLPDPDIDASLNSGLR